VQKRRAANLEIALHIFLAGYVHEHVLGPTIIKHAPRRSREEIYKASGGQATAEASLNDHPPEEIHWGHPGL
jgi:hypothetical protein